MRRMRLGVNFVVPFVVVGMLVMMVLIRLNTTSSIEQSALRGNKAAAQIACEAVHDAGVDQHTFLVRSFGMNPRPESKVFLAELLTSVEDNYKACIVKTRTLGDSNGIAHR